MANEYRRYSGGKEQGMKEVCGTCKYNRRTYDGHCWAEFGCGNEESDNCGVPTFYDDTCDDWEEKE